MCYIIITEPKTILYEVYAMLDLILTLMVWSLLGYIISDFVLYIYKDEQIRRGEMNGIEGLEYLNPTWLYQNFRVNYFGTVLLTVFHNLLCPVGSVYYWSKKICTVGRN